MTMMHHFLPSGTIYQTVRQFRYLRKVMPSSIVPYMVTLPVPAPDVEPPCAQAPSNTIDATKAKTIFMTAFLRKTGVDSSLAVEAHA